MRVVVVGGGPGGLFATLLLARSGHEVTLLEKGTCGSASSLEQAASRGPGRRTYPHVFLPRTLQLLGRAAPAVVHGLSASGARLLKLKPAGGSFLLHRSASLDDHGDLVALMARKELLAAALWRQLRLEQLDVKVVNVVQSGDLQQGHEADLIVDARGRHGRYDQDHPSGVCAYTRWYRETAAMLPALDRTLCAGAEDPERMFTLSPSDNGYAAVTIFVDPSLPDRRALRSVDAFDAAVARTGAIGSWVASRSVHPVTGVLAFAGGRNSYRKPIMSTTSGPPVIRIGDALATTNPMYGRGTAMAFESAAIIDACMTEAGSLAGAQSAYVEAIEQRLRPWWAECVVRDARRRGEGVPDLSGWGSRALAALELADELQYRADHDARAWELLFRATGMLVTVDEFLAAESRLTRQVV